MNDASQATTVANKRRWFVPRFSLRTVLVVITLFGVTVGCWCERAERQRRVVEMLEESGRCKCDFSPEPFWVKCVPQAVRDFRGGHYVRTVESIHLEDHRSGGLALCQQLPRLASLVIGSPLADGDLEQIARIPGLKSLSFTAESIQEDDIPHLRILSRLRKVECFLNNSSEDSNSLRCLGELVSLTSLRFDYCSDDDLKYLVPLVRLESLSIGDGLSGDGLQCLHHLPLKRLGFEWSGFDDRGGASLSKFLTLEEVFLTGTLAGNDTAKALAQLPQLTTADLSFTLLDDEGAEALARSRSLTNLSVGFTAIGPKGLAALATSPTLRHLDLNGVPVSREDLAKFSSTPALLELGLGDPPYLSRARLSKLSTEAPDVMERDIIWLSPQERTELYRADFATASSDEERAELQLLWSMNWGENREKSFGPFSDECMKLVPVVPGVESLELSCSIVTDQGLASLATVTSLQSLNCSKTAISLVGLEHLVGLPALERLNLSHCKNIDGSAADVLCRMKALKELDLSGTNMTRDGVIQLASSKEFKRLTCDFGVIYDRVPDQRLSFNLGKFKRESGLDALASGSLVKALLTFAPTRISLDLSNDGPLTGEQVARLAKSTHLQQLRAEMSDEQFAVLHGLTALTDIGLVGPHIGKSSIRSALQRQGLEELHLIRVRLPSDDWVELRDANVKLLVLDDVEVSDVWGDALATMPRLEALSLQGSAVSNQSVSRLIECCPNLKALSFDASHCSPEVTRQVIRGLPKLEFLDLGQGNLGPYQFAILRGGQEYEASLKRGREAMKRRSMGKDPPPQREIDLTGPWVDDSIGMPDDHSLLRSVQLTNTNITGTTVERLADCDELRCLDLSGSAISDSDMEFVFGFADLETLQLNDCAISGETLEKFVSCPNLKTLGLARTHIDDQALAVLAKYRRLEKLDLSELAVTNQGAELLSAVKSLQALRLSGTQIGDDGLKRLGGLKQLRSLDLGQTSVGDEGMATIGRLLRLSRVDLRETKVTDEGIASLAALRQAELIDLRGTQVTPDGVAKLRRALPYCRILLTESDSVMAETLGELDDNAG